MNQEVSPIAWILLVVFVTVLTLITYLYWETKLHESRMERYFEVARSVATLVSVLTSIYLIQFYFSQAAQQEKLRINADLEQRSVDIQKLFLDPFWHKDLTQLYLEMNPLLSRTEEQPIQGDPDHDNPIRQSEYIVGNIILRKMETVLAYLGEQSNQPGFLEWKRQWQTWMSSSRLRKIWEMSQDQYSSTMKQFVSQQLIT